MKNVTNSTKKCPLDIMCKGKPYGCQHLHS